MALVENLAAFLPDFGVDATISGATVRGIFDADWQDAVGIVPGVEPVFVCRSSDVAATAIDASVVINGISYLLARKEPDGTGFTRLRLEAV